MDTVFDQNNADFYDNHILLRVTMVRLFRPEFGLKPRYFAFIYI